MPATQQDSRKPEEVAGHGARAPRSWRIAATWALFGLLAAGSSAAAPTGKVGRVAYPDSVREIPAATNGTTAAQHRARIVRAALDSAETDATIDFEVALKMRNFAELQARVARGEIIPREEMAAKYFPLAADYEAVRTWLNAKGLTISSEDSTRLSIFARGSISQVKEVFEVEFARVATDEGEYTSAITVPSVPIGLAAPLLGVNGLQPHLRPHKMVNTLGAQKASLSNPNAPPYLPAAILKAYSANTTGLTGAGQTIAIVIDTWPLDSDLTTFWSRCGINPTDPTPLSRIQKIQVTGTPTPPDPTALDQNGVPLGTEAVIDAELTSSVAPGATIRIYSVGSLDFRYLTRAYQQIYGEMLSQPGMHLVNLSYGVAESYLLANAPSQLQSDAQNFATLASAGVTVFASSGDGGSNPNNNGRYSASSPASPSHPASDPNVTGVGATRLFLNSSGVTSSETGWTLSSTGGTAASGGGISTIFARPDWQMGTNVSGSMRLVPDVSVMGDPSTGAYIVNVGTDSTLWGGTSISAPIWSGFGALLNQARASAGLPSLGLLGPKIYPLIGTTSLRDITTGNNGLYDAGAGYDMVTGVGTPVMSALAQALASPASPPAITAQPVSQTVAAGQNATFSVTISASPLPSYRWQRQAAGSTLWSDLSNTATYGGTATATLTVNSVTAAMSGDSFRCTATNEVGTVTTSSATLIVASPLTIITLAGQAGSSGSADGTGAAARFNHPSDLAIDSTGNVYVTDTNNQTIRKITSAGVVSTFAGLAGSSPGSADGIGTAARFNNPTGITADGSGNLYVADTDNHTIRRISSAGAVTTFAGRAGSPGSTDGSAAQFNSPSDVTVDGVGNVYVADTRNHTIRKIAPAGVVSTLAGQAGSSGNANGSGSVARFSAPEGVAVDNAGNVYVADTNNHTIRKVTPTGAVSTLAGLAAVSGTSDGAGSGARFQFPSDLAVDGSGNLYVADTDNHAIRIVNPVGAVGTVAGQAGASGSTDGTGSSARFYYPAGVAVDGSGNVYIADTNNHTIRNSTTATAPVIQTQPQSQTVNVGANVSFSVVATGVPAPTYQWQFNGTAISGATSATLNLINVQTTNAGSYTVVVSNSAGSTTSNAASLTVNTPAPSPSASSGGGGGGGAMQVWFVLALALLGAARRVARNR